LLKDIKFPFKRIKIKANLNKQQKQGLLKGLISFKYYSLMGFCNGYISYN